MASTSSWFTDPIAEVRGTLVAVPADPSAYDGPLVRTRAYAMSYGGAVAPPGKYLARPVAAARASRFARRSRPVRRPQRRADGVRASPDQSRRSEPCVRARGDV
jgi:hypothetical protein